jgi:multidrug efflux pump subunit AcrA (membrane-fusion protein)
VLILVGCGQQADETAAPDPFADYEPVVSVTGQLVPAVRADLSSQSGGLVAEVLVEPGDEVEEGTVLIRVDSTDAQLALQQAEAALAAADAQLALLQAGPRPEEIAAAEASLAAAQAAVSQAVAGRDQLEAGTLEAEIEAAQAQVAAAQAEELVAREAHDQTMRCYTLPDGSEACPALGTLEEQARYGYHAAREALEAAQAQLDALMEGTEGHQLAANAAVWVAAAQRDVAQAQLELLQSGATSEEIALAEASVAQAAAALEVARVALDRCETRAPFAGTVGAVYIRLGELIVPGQMLLTLGDLDTLQVETTDLDEIDVAQVELGQAAEITFDALPDTVFSGRLVHISPMAESGTGGVNYTAIIEPDALDPLIRWGMTAFVDIEIGQ